MSLLKKTSTGSSEAKHALAHALTETVDRRAFLKRAGLTAGAGLLARHLPFNVIERAKAQPAVAAPAGANVEIKHTICSHCSVGCSVEAVVQNGVWVRQDTAFDSPINLG